MLAGLLYAHVNGFLLAILQHCPPGRFFSLLIGAAVLYLTSYTPLRRWLQRMAGLHPPPVAAPAAAAAAVAQPGAAPPVAAPAAGTCTSRCRRLGLGVGSW